jgi:hypothetical protein
MSVSLSGDHLTLLDSILTATSKSKDTLTYVYPTQKTDAGTIHASAFDVLTILAPHAPTSLLRALDTQILIGTISIETKEPYLILESKNFDASFPGMLTWESSMSQDLSPFFGTPVTHSLIEARGGQVINPQFTDVLSENRSIRILYDETGKERIVYAFINRNRIYITTSTKALSQLIERIP